MALTPQDAPGATTKVWVAPEGFAGYFPRLPKDRFMELLAGVRGALLSPSQLAALAHRIEEALGDPPD